jgi:hypothetical protein
VILQESNLSIVDVCIANKSANAKFPYNLPLFLSQDGVACVELKKDGNSFAFRIGSKQLDSIIRAYAQTEGRSLNKFQLSDINDNLRTQAELSSMVKPIWSRVAPINGGIELDMCDAENTRIRVTPSKVEIIKQCSDALFYRNPNAQPMVIPAAKGDLKLLEKYVNLKPVDLLLFTAWLSYTLAHPKVTTSNYVILVLQGDQGSGKTFICQSVIIKLLDPSCVGVQMFPGNAKDLAIAAQYAHVLCYDNMRGFKSTMADTLCIASTGGTITNRALYTDGDQHVLRLHVPLVLNGIHDFITQSDLAQRCLPIRTITIPESQRKSESVMVKELETDLPVIFRGLLDLIAGVFKHLPDVKATTPERMIDFVHWLAAMEIVYEAPTGIFQTLYSNLLHQSHLDSLMENLLASAIIDFSETCLNNDVWKGKPAELLEKLNIMGSSSNISSYEWPKNPIALSKRLNSLKASLLTQGIGVESGRGKERTITIKKVGGNHG